MLQEQAISVNFGQGLDSKTDPKMVLPGKLTLLQNGVFTKAKQITKRNGSNALSNTIIGGGTLTSPVMTKAYQNELVAADGNYLYSYSESVGAWAKKGAYTSAKVTNTAVSSAIGTQFAQSSAILGNYLLSCYTATYDTGGTGTTYELFASVIDLESNTRLLSDSVIVTSTASNFPVGKCVALAGSSLALTYVDAAGNLQLKILTISGSTVSFGSAILLTSTPAFLKGYAQFDIQSTSNGAVFIYNASGGTLPVINISTSGTLSTPYILSPGTVECLSVCPDAYSQYWIYWGTSGSVVTYQVLTSALGLITSPTTIYTSTSGTISQIAALSTSSTTQYVYYSVPQTTSGSSTYNIKSSTVSSSAVVTAGPFSLVGADLATRPFSQGGNTYIGVIYLSSKVTYNSVSQVNQVISGDQVGVFFVQCDSIRPGYVVGKALYGKMPYYSSASVACFGPSYLCPVGANGSIQYTALPQLIQNVISGAGGSLFSKLVSTTLIGIDFGNNDLNQGIEAGQALVLNGLPQVYDGASIGELGFLVYPELIGIPSALATGGFLATSALYTYAIIANWTDAQGNQYQSSPFTFQVYIPSGSGAGSCTFAVRYVNLTQRNFPNSIQLAIYRTTSNGSTLSLLTSAVAYTNSVGVEGFSYTDTTPDSYLSTANILYADGGILANDPPPSSVVMTRHNNRVWMVDSENETSIWPSNTIVPLNGLSFSSDLAINLDERGGPITGLAEMEYVLVGFKGTMPFIIGGDAANSAGAGSSLQPALFIPSDAGCNSSKSIVTLPFGILFKSDKGIYLFDRSFNVSYVGAEVEEFNTLTITAATIVSDKTQVRFLTSGSVALVFDYLFKQWSTFTNHGGLSADIWNGAYIYATSAGAVFQETPGYYLDGSSSFQLRAQLGWINFGASIQGFQRVRRAALLGDYANGASSGHGVQVSAAYDFSTTFQAPIAYSFGSASTAAPFQYRERLPIQKCGALQLLIEEIVTGDSAESIDLSDLAFEVGIKRGLNKLPSSMTVG